MAHLSDRSSFGVRNRSAGLQYTILIIMQYILIATEIKSNEIKICNVHSYVLTAYTMDLHQTFNVFN